MPGHEEDELKVVQDEVNLGDAKLVAASEILGETIDVPNFTPIGSHPFNPVREKALGATWVARALLYIFGGYLGLNLLVAGLFVLYAGVKGGDLLEKYLAFVKEIGVVQSTLFSPLLAFVLGYYFSDGKRK